MFKQRAASSFVLCCLYPASLQGQSQSQKAGDADWRVPLAPDDKRPFHESTQTPAAVTPDAAVKRAFEKTSENVESQHSRPVNAGEVPFADGRPSAGPQTKSLFDVFSNITGAQVSRGGGEGAGVSIRLRGARAFEPVYFFDGVPLTGVFVGEQSLELLPMNNFGAVLSYPDSPPFWLPQGNVAGVIDFKPCQRSLCLPRASEAALAAGLADVKMGSYGFVQASGMIDALVRRDAWLSGALQLTQAREDFWVRNDNGTLFRTDDDTLERRRNNDFKRASFGANAVLKNISRIGELSALVTGGAEERGLAGEVGSSGRGRLHRMLVLGSVKTRTLNAASGAWFTSQVFAKGERASTHMTEATPSATVPSHLTLDVSGARGTLEFPWEFGPPGISANVKSENVNANSGTGSPTDSPIPTSGKTGLSLFAVFQKVSGQARGQSRVALAGSRNEMHLMVAQTLAKTLTSESVLTLSVQGDADVTWSRFQVDCNHALGFPGCGKQQRNQAVALPSYTVSVQASLARIVVPYVRFSHLSRRPFLQEQFGSVQGLVPNIALKNETTETIELGLKTAWAGGGCYLGNDRELIVLQRVNPVVSQFQNTEQVRRTGCFADVAAQLWTYAFLKADSRWLKTRALYGDGGPARELPRSAHYSGQMTIGVEQVPVPWAMKGAQSWGGFVRGSQQSAIFLDAANNIKLDLPPMFDAGLSWQGAEVGAINSLLGGLQFTLDIMNITGSTLSTQTDATGRQMSVASSGFSGFPAPGRRYYATLSKAF